MPTERQAIARTLASFALAAPLILTFTTPAHAAVFGKKCAGVSLPRCVWVEGTVGDTWQVRADIRDAPAAPNYQLDLTEVGHVGNMWPDGDGPFDLSDTGPAPRRVCLAGDPAFRTIRADYWWKQPGHAAVHGWIENRVKVC